LPFNNYNYSYVNVATDQYKYSTLSFDRLGIGNSSYGEPLNEIQIFLEIAATAQLTQMLRNGTFPGVNHTFSKVVHVGHSFGSAQTYALVSMYPNITDGIVLTGFSMNESFVNPFIAGGNFQQADRNQPLRIVTSLEPKLRMFSQCMQNLWPHTSPPLT
jgi:pimeloyl-ACP methyl ester carboxylesterase